jgi:hypothetical protein
MHLGRRDVNKGSYDELRSVERNERSVQGTENSDM